MPQKINWKLFANESCVLIAHTMLAGFFFRIAQNLFEYYRQPFLAAFFLVLCLFFAIPLAVNMLDLWACSLGAVHEDALAEKMLKASIAVHKSLFGANNAYLAEKKGMLASLYFANGKVAEAEKLFKEAFETYNKSAIKLPWLHTCFANYLKLLRTAGDTDTALKLQSKLQSSKLYMLVQKLSIALIAVPILTFLFTNQATERDIAKCNAQGQMLVALKDLNLLAHRQSLLLGDYAAARVYTDYALAFDENEEQQKETEWCTDKALSALSRSGTTDEYLHVMLLNLKGKASLAEGKNDESLKYFQEAASISMKWDNNQLARNKFDAGFERDKSIFALAELERNKGNFEKAEALYNKALDVSNDSPEFQAIKIAGRDPVETVDRLHKLQHIELKLDKKAEVLKLQERICTILGDSAAKFAAAKKSALIRDYATREAAREYDVCALMMQEAGRNKDAKDYQSKADHLRDSHNKAIKLNPVQQDSIVDTTTQVTNELLSVKYRAGDWQQSLDHLLQDELKSKKARGAFEHLPWYDASDIQKAKSDKTAGSAAKTLAVDFGPMSIRSNRDGDGIAVDVEGTVKIINSQLKSEDERNFGFAYVMNSQNMGRPSVEDLFDNQALSHVKFD